MDEIKNLFNDCCVSYSTDNFIVDKDYLQNVHNNNVYNNIIVGYYKRLQSESYNTINFDSGNTVKFNCITDNVIKSIENCNKHFTIDRYDYNLVKDFIRTDLCHSKFCNNCKKVKQACRMSRYIPELEVYSDSLFHIIFTLPNCCGSDLKSILKKMSVSFKKLIRYINGNKKLSFIDFSKYGYLGSIRSLEITFKGDSYHPHYHCAFVFKNLDLDYSIKNTYSYDFYGNKDLRLFSEFEIILQKLWYMCLNDINITKDNYDQVDLGYSVLCNKFNDNDYAELFKYMTKETDEVNNILTYDNFKTLWYSTYAIKQIQGYGIFFRITDSDLSSEIDVIYEDIVKFLNSDESPVRYRQSTIELLNDNNYTLISRKKIYQYLRQLDKK